MCAGRGGCEGWGEGGAGGGVVCQTSVVGFGMFALLAHSDPCFKAAAPPPAADTPREDRLHFQSVDVYFY